MSCELLLCVFVEERGVWRGTRRPFGPPQHGDLPTTVEPGHGQLRLLPAQGPHLCAKQER